jgi:cellulose biosynthesis protein BcsQ
MAMDDVTRGQIVTFYSYKGGTGRTMALANVAWILASNGLRVLAIDWDLESPGLHRYFHPFLDQSSLVATPGVIDIISDYGWAATNNSEQRPNNWYVKYANVLMHAVSLDWLDFPNTGALDFISAGRQNRSYSSAIGSIDWDNFYDRLGGGQFIEAMRTEMKKAYDYILIDARTGLSDLADICTIQFPDILIVCFTLNDQSIDGASAVAHHIDGWYHNRNIRILPVPMRVEDAQLERLAVGRMLAQVKFDDLPRGLNPEQFAQYWASIEIPYKPQYAFEEVLAAFGDAPGSPTSLLAAFERLTSTITHGNISSMPALSEEIRVRYLRKFDRRHPIS